MNTSRFHSIVFLLCFVAGLIFAAAPAGAQTDQGPAADTIASLEFQGNRRTKEAVLRGAVDAEPGDRFDAETVEQIEDDLKSLGLFSSVEIETSPLPGGVGEVAVLVTVEERWSIVPIPFFATGSSGFTAGLFVFEGNLLGYNKQLIAGGTYANDGFGGLLVYSDPALLGSDWLLSTSLSAGSEDVETADTAYRDRWTYAADQVTVGGSVGYRFRDGFSIRGGTAYRYLEVTESEDPDIVGQGGYGFVTYTTEVGLIRTEPEEFFDSGYTLQASAEATPRESGWGLSVAGTRNVLVAGSHRLGLGIRSEYGDRPLFAQAAPRGTADTANAYAGDSLARQLRFSGGSLRASAFSPLLGNHHPTRLLRGRLSGRCRCRLPRWWRRRAALSEPGNLPGGGL